MLTPAIDGGSTDALESLLRPSDVAQALGVSRTWLYDAAKAGRIPSVRLGGPDGPLRFLPSEIRQWIAAAAAGRQIAGESRPADITAGRRCNS